MKLAQNMNKQKLCFLHQYEYQYEVKDPEKMLFFDKNEMGDGTGKVFKPFSLTLGQ